MNQLELYDDIANDLSNTLMDGEYGTFDEVCVEASLDENYKMVIWGEENDKEDRFFSVSVYDQKDQQIINIFSESENMADLRDAVFQALEQFKDMVPQPQRDVQEPNVKLWARVGVTLNVTQEELQELQKGNVASKNLFVELMRSDRCILDGETYFPEEANEKHLREEMGFELYTPLQKETADKLAQDKQERIDYYCPTVAEQAFNLYDAGYLTEHQYNYVQFNIEQVTSLYIQMADYWEKTNNRELPLSEDIDLMQKAIEHKAADCTRFRPHCVFAEQDEKSETLRAELRLTGPMKSMIRQEVMRLGNEELKQMRATSCYARYNLKEDSVTIVARYAYEKDQKTNGGKLEIPLAGDRKMELISQLNSHCLEHVKQNCLNYLNDRRLSVGMPALETPKPPLDSRIQTAQERANNPAAAGQNKTQGLQSNPER